jgi:hypothetical protein
VGSRFVVGSDVYGADILGMYKKVTWEEQKIRFAEIILTNIFAVYESWARRLIDTTQMATAGFEDRDLSNFGSGRRPGLQAFLNQVNATSSPTTLQPAFRAHRKVHAAQLMDMLRCYRYFKELRNCRIHNGGIADRKAVDAYNDFLPVSSAASLRTKETIQHFPVALGQPTDLSLRGVVGFCDIVLRMMVTIDAEISGSDIAERVVVDRIRIFRGSRVPKIPSSPTKVTRLANRLCRNANLPTPHLAPDFCQLMVRNGIVLP